MIATLGDEHLADLRRSGLDDKTIAGCAFESDGANLAIPYFDLDGQPNGFARVKLFPPIQNNGHTQKYSQPMGTRPYVYVPPLHDWRTIAADPHHPILICEGEKKTACGCQCGFAALGIGGVWNWRAKLDSGERGVIPDLDALAWNGRTVELCPDSDAWRPDKMMHILAGFYALGQELARRGAHVKFVKLPDHDGQKCGFDDFIVAAGAAWRPAWDALERLGPGAPTFASVAEWYARWQRRQCEPQPSEPHNTDLGNAQRLVVRHGEDLRFSPALGWLVWDGRRWATDEAAALRLAKNTILELYGEAARLPDAETRKALVAHALKSESDPRLRATLSLAESESRMSIESDALDRNAWMLNCANGVLDLKTADLRPHARDLFMTKLVPVPYALQATCPQWEKFLDRVFASDVQLIAFVQRAVGYSLTGDTSEQVLFVLHGLGANGKSTFVKTLMHVFADYALNTPTATLLVKRNDGIPNDIARLAGARFVSAVETEGGRRLAESLVKALTGGDTMSARFLHREFFDFTPCCKIWLACNHRPRIIGTDHAMWRRVRLIPFDVTIPEPERDPHLLDKLRDEAPGILQWALEGCVAWQQIGLGLPEAVKKASADYRSDMDLIGDFLREHCIVEPSATESAKDLYATYAKWAEECGEKPMTKKALAGCWAERSFAPGVSHNERTWCGLRLRLPTDPEAPTPSPATATREEYQL